MLQEERFNIILSELAVKGAVKVTALASLLQASESTVRRDINELDSAGRVRKVFGGAVAAARHIKTVEENVESKSGIRTREKESIARYAAGLLRDNDFVFIDAGTTTERMIDFLDNYSVTYVTNGIPHGLKLAQRGFKVFLTGGQPKQTTLSITGAEAVGFLGKCNFTKCFMGANGIDPQRGFSTPDFDEALVKAEAMKRSSETYILADGSKFGCVSAATFGKLTEACIITDHLSDSSFRKYTVIKETESDQ